MFLAIYVLTFEVIPWAKVAAWMSLSYEKPQQALDSLLSPDAPLLSLQMLFAVASVTGAKVPQRSPHISIGSGKMPPLRVLSHFVSLSEHAACASAIPLCR